MTAGVDVASCRVLQGILSTRMFTMMILMAIITTCMTAPGGYKVPNSARRRLSTVNISKAVHTAGSAQSTAAKQCTPQAQHSRQQQSSARRRLSTVDSSKTSHAAVSAESTAANSARCRPSTANSSKTGHAAGSAQSTAAKQGMPQAQHSQQQHPLAAVKQLHHRFSRKAVASSASVTGFLPPPIAIAS
jgi:hypothetical protein